MVATDEDALTCDFAETYHIYRWRDLPVRYAAILAVGLRDDSRIKLKMAGTTVPTKLWIAAATLDAANKLVWMQTRDAKHRRNEPKSILGILMNQEHPKELATFSSAEEFERRRAELMEKYNGD